MCLIYLTFVHSDAGTFDPNNTFLIPRITACPPCSSGAYGDSFCYDPHGPFFHSPRLVFGGGQQNPDWEALRKLGEWVSTNVLKLNRVPGEAWGKELVLEVARRNSEMVAAWQAYGFMHGVINTDKYVPTILHRVFIVANSLAAYPSLV
jgi:hypothetical protein